MIEPGWIETSKRACTSKELFEENYHSLPGKVKQLLKHLDPRAKSQRNVDKDVEKLEDEEKKTIDKLLKYHQALPLKHKYPKPRHQNKFQSKSKTKSKNHLISKDEMKGFKKRG
jgi:hypothetical protein